MRTKTEVTQVLDATYKADPDFEDSDMDMIRDTLRWVLGEGYDESTAQQFIKFHISEDL
jgi:hypothetical protein